MDKVPVWEGVERVELLRAMWKRSSPAPFFRNRGIEPPGFSEEAAKEALEPKDGHCFIDYFQGRMIKTDLCADELDPYLYDRDLGPCALLMVVIEASANSDA